MLISKGHIAHTPTLIGLGERAHLFSEEIDLTAQITDLSNYINQHEIENFILCGHSLGGMVISGTIEQIKPDRIRGLVYIDAMYTAPGESSLDHLPLPPGENEETGVALPPPAEMFGLAGKDADRYNSLVTPQPMGTLTEKLEFSDRREDVRAKLFAYSSETARVMPLFFQMSETLASRPSWKIEVLQGGHLSAIDQPAETASMLLRFADESG
jgi:pimeloyl-ACP methyl ester carboxylesterase